MSRVKLYTMALLLPLIWGSVFILVKFGLQGFTPVNLTIMRFVIAGCICVPLFLTRAITYRPIQRQDYVRVLILLVAMLVGQLGLGIVMRRIPASVASLIVQIAPAFTYGLAVALGVERLRFRLVTGVALAFVGVVSVVTRSEGEANESLAPALLAIAFLVPFAIAVYTVVGKPMFVKYGPANLSGQLLIAMSILMGALVPFRGQLIEEILHASPKAWVGVLGLAIPATVGAYLLFSLVLKQMTRMEVASLMYLVPIVSVSLACMLLGETFNSAMLLGGCLVIAGLVVIDRG